MTPSPSDDELQSDDLPQNQEMDETADHIGAEAIAEAIQAACDSEAADATEADDIASQLNAEKDRVLRLQAEMENLRSRTSREIIDERRYAALPVARDLLPVVDNIDRAILAAEQSSDAGSLLEGFKLVRQQIVTLLEQHNCKPIPAVGQPFDPQIHEAILQQPSDEQPANHVLQETQVGYQLHDRVIRPSQVIISSGPADA